MNTPTDIEPAAPPALGLAVVLAAANYPGDPRTGDVITGIADAQIEIGRAHV